MKRLEPQRRSRLYWVLSDYSVLIRRSTVYIIRNMDQALSTIVEPVIFLLLFRYVFGGAIVTPGISYVNYLFAGILVQTVAFGSTYTALGVTTDIRRGIIDRFKSLPMASSAVLVGHTITDLVRNTISAIVMVLVGLLTGFRPTASAWDWLLLLGLLMLFTFSLSWVFAIMGLLSKTIEGVQWITFIFIFPLTFVSSAFVPVSSMAPWIRAFAQNQPLTHIIDASRALTIGTPMGNHGLLAVVWSAGLLAVAFPAAVWLFNHKTVGQQ